MKKYLFLILICSLPAAFLCENIDQTGEQKQRDINISRYGSLIKLKKEYEEQYIILHKYTFPGVLDRINKSNIRNYSIFLKDGMLFSHFEYIGSNFQSDMAQMADEVTSDWWQLTDPMQEPLANRKEGEWWASMNLLYLMDASQIAYQQVQRFAFRAELKSDKEQNFKERVNQINKYLVELFLNHHFQNFTVYVYDNRLYLYFEYSGSAFEKNWNQLEYDIKFRNLYEDLNTCLKPLPGDEINEYWQQMSEVFHTN